MNRTLGSTLRGIVPDASRRRKMHKRKVLTFDTRLDDIDKPFTSAEIFQDPFQVRCLSTIEYVKDSVRKLVAHDLAAECSIRRVRPSNERVMRNVGGGRVGGGRVSQPPLVVVNELRSICETVLRDEEPLLPTGVVLVDAEQVVLRVCVLRVHKSRRGVDDLGPMVPRVRGSAPFFFDVGKG